MRLGQAHALDPVDISHNGSCVQGWALTRRDGPELARERALVRLLKRMAHPPTVTASGFLQGVAILE